MKRWLYTFVSVSVLLSGCRQETAVSTPGQCPYDSGTLLPLDAAAGADSSAPACTTDGQVPKYSVSRPLGYYRGDPIPDHMAYLTFSDGPTDWTTDFLDILKAKDVRATFFVSAINTKKNGLDGSYVDASGKTVFYREILKRQVDEGHALGNLTVRHVDLSNLTPPEIAQELDENERLVNASLVRVGLAPMHLTLLRAPYGRPWECPGTKPANYAEILQTVGAAFERRGLNIFFNVDSTDWQDAAQGETYLRNPPRPPSPNDSTLSWNEKVARIRNAVLGYHLVTAGKGIVVSFHDTHPTTRDALADIIDGLRAAGYQFGTMEDYAQWRWGRPSADLSPGPSLYSTCVEEKHWGCQSFGVPVGTDRAREVCGRTWLTFQAYGGVAVLGEPRGTPTVVPEKGAIVQTFERATIEWYPQNSRPCEVRVVSAENTPIP